MKTIVKEWCKDKTACWMLLGYFMSSIGCSVIGVMIITLISNAIAYIDRWAYHLTILALALIAQTALSMIKGLLSSLSIHHCYTTLHNEYTDKVLDADVQMFTRYSCSDINTAGEFMSSITKGGMSIVDFVLSIISVASILISIYLVGGWKIILSVVIIYFIGAIWSKRLFDKYEKLDKECNRIKRIRNQETDNAVYGFMEVRSFSTQDWHRNRIRQYNRDMYDARVQRSKTQMITNLEYELIDATGIVAIIVYAIFQMQSGLITQAAAMSLVMYVLKLGNPLDCVVNLMSGISEMLSMSDAYESIANYANACPDNGTIEMDSFEDEICLDHVSFAYNNSESVLEDINMIIPKGQKVGICGASGAGKTSLFKLLNRFYDASSGSITVDGIDIKEFTKSSYRKHIACVHQDNTVFPGTIMENVTYGSFNVPEYEIVMACKKANIYDFIMSLPDKFNTRVGPRGLTLSGGQRQRVALARLFLADPDIILLDEATSALDNESETFIQDAIDSLKGKTIITIAHRLSTIKNSDLIYVMGSHGILEWGSHDELMAKKGAYYRMNK